MALTDSVSRWCGLLAPFIGITGFLAAAVIHPSFQFAGSDMVVLKNPRLLSSAVFDVGLMLAGLLGVGFTWRLWTESRHLLESIGAVLFGAAAGSLAATGFIAAQGGWYLSVALGALFFAVYTLFITGTAALLRGTTRTGLVSIWLGVGHATVWGLWLVGLFPGTGSAGPALVSGVLIGGWMVWRAEAMVGGGRLTRLLEQGVAKLWEWRERLPV